MPYLGLNALPIGVVCSVNSFLRVSMASWYIGVRGLILCWTALLDDYTLITTWACSSNAAVVAEKSFSTFGNLFCEGRQESSALGNSGLCVGSEVGRGSLRKWFRAIDHRPHREQGAGVVSSA